MMSEETLLNDLWYYSQNNQQLGPVPFSTLQQLVSTGGLRAGDLVWQQGTEAWLPVCEIPRLVENIPAATQIPALPGWRPAERYGERLQEIRELTDRVGELDQTESTLQALPHLRYIHQLLTGWTQQVTVHQLDLADRLTKRVGSMAYMLAAALYTVFFIFVSLREDSIQKLLATILVVVPSVTLCHYVAVHFLETSRETLRQTPTELSSQNLAMGAALLSCIGGVYLLVTRSHDLFREINVTGSLLEIPLAVFLIYTAGACLNPGSLTFTTDTQTDAAREAIGISMFLPKILLRGVPMIFGLYAVLAAGSGVYFASKVTSDDLDKYSGMAMELAPRVLMVGLIPPILYLIAVFSSLMIDTLRALLNTAVATREIARAMPRGGLSVRQ
jgi:hypothetical protein